LSIYDNGAGTALSETAAKLRPVHFKVIPQRVKQRGVVVDFDFVRFAINTKID
jgi:hypothetical protein